MGYMAALIVFQAIVITHVVRTGRTQPWLFIVAFLPLVGSLAYFAAEVLPEMLSGGRGDNLADSLRNRMDPEHRYRKLKDVALLAETPDAKRALAEECVRLGKFDEAIEAYQSAMTGLHAADPALLHGAAIAFVEAADANVCPWNQAEAAIKRLHDADTAYKAADQALLHARVASALGKNSDAENFYKQAIAGFSGPEPRVRYAHFLFSQGRLAEARDGLEKLIAEERRLPHHARKINATWLAEAHKAIRIVVDAQSSAETQPRPAPG